MFAETAIALMLLLGAEPGAKKKPTASQLSTPTLATDAGVHSGASATSAKNAGSTALTAKVDGGTKTSETSKNATDGGTGKANDAADGGTAKPTNKIAMAPEVKSLVDRMQAFYEKTEDFTASFRQDYKYKLAKRTVTSTGTVVFKKPALMRWEYLTPAPKTFVLAGDTVYAHDPAAMMLTVGSINTNQLSASVTFLWGKGKLADEFNITQASCAKCTGTLLELNPLVPDPRFQKVLLEVDPKTAQVLKSTVIDPDGSENAISFSNLKANTGVTPETFKLNPPEGTQVQDFRQKK